MKKICLAVLLFVLLSVAVNVTISNASTIFWANDPSNTYPLYVKITTPTVVEIGTSTYYNVYNVIDPEIWVGTNASNAVQGEGHSPLPPYYWYSLGFRVDGNGILYDVEFSARGIWDHYLIFGPQTNNRVWVDSDWAGDYSTFRLRPLEGLDYSYTGYWYIPQGATAPTPIPTTLLLLGSGVVGLFGFRRKFGK